MQSTSQVTPCAQQNPVIGSMTYTSGTLMVGEIETLRFTLSETNSTYLNRKYWVEVYQRTGNTYTLKSSKSVALPSGSTSQTVTFNLQFTDTGSFYTYVKVFLSDASTLMTSREGVSPDTVYGKWKITITEMLSSERSDYDDAPNDRL